MRKPRADFQAPPKALRDVRVREIGARGDGIGEGVFAPFTLPGELARMWVSGERAELAEILEPSGERVEPPCPHFGVCGGCALQHWAHEPYLAWKAALIGQALARERIETEILPAAASPPGSRRRLALHARKGTPGRARLGYKVRGGWTLVEIAVCPIADRRLVDAFEGLRALAAPFLEHPKSAPTLHVTLTRSGLDIDVTGVEQRSGGLSADARLRAAEAAQAMDAARVTLAGEIVYQARQSLVMLGRASLALPPGAFMQATPQGEDAMTAFAVQALAGAERAADLFSGVGTFTFRMAEAVRVHAADASAPAIAALNAAIATAPGLKEITSETRDLYRRPMLASELKGFDAVVFDPPRAGAAEQAVQIAESRVGLVVGVSCNPATFARDARILTGAGFRLERVLPVDQFLWSPHVELVGVFGR